MKAPNGFVAEKRYRELARSYRIARANRLEAHYAMLLIREAVETLGPIGCMGSSEESPSFDYEARQIIRGIQAIADNARDRNRAPLPPWDYLEDPKLDTLAAARRRAATAAPRHADDDASAG